MPVLMETELKIKKLWFEDNKICIQTEDNTNLWQSLLCYKRLLHATDEQRNNYRFSYSGIHWGCVDEDISFESFLAPHNSKKIASLPPPPTV